MPKVSKEDKPKPVPKGKTIAELAREMRQWETKKKRAEKTVEGAKSMIHEIATKYLPPLMDKVEGDGLNIPGVAYVELKSELYTHVNKADVPIFYQWLKDNQQGSLVVEYVWPKTLNAWAGEQLAEQRALPDVVKTTFIPTAKLLKPRKK